MDTRDKQGSLMRKVEPSVLVKLTLKELDVILQHPEYANSEHWRKIEEQLVLKAAGFRFKTISQLPMWGWTAGEWETERIISSYLRCFSRSYYEVRDNRSGDTCTAPDMESAFRLSRQFAVQEAFRRINRQMPTNREGAKR